MMGSNGYRHQPDYDRCGWGTAWGCGEHLHPGQDVSIVLNATHPEDAADNGHRLFHTACMPESAVPALRNRKLPGELTRITDSGTRRRLRVASGS